MLEFDGVNAYFQYIAGAASIVALVLTLAKDVFPDHKVAKVIVLISALSLLAGTLLGPIDQVSISFSKVLNPIAILLFLLMTATALAAVYCHVWEPFIEDDEKRQRIATYGGNSAISFIVFLVIYGVAFGLNDDREDITDRELVVLVNVNIENGNLRRARDHLQELKSRSRANSKYWLEVVAQLESLDEQIAAEVNLGLPEKKGEER